MITDHDADMTVQANYSNFKLALFDYFTKNESDLCTCQYTFEGIFNQNDHFNAPQNRL